MNSSFVCAVKWFHMKMCITREHVFFTIYKVQQKVLMNGLEVFGSSFDGRFDTIGKYAHEFACKSPFCDVFFIC